MFHPVDALRIDALHDLDFVLCCWCPCLCILADLNARGAHLPARSIPAHASPLGRTISVVLGGVALNRLYSSTIIIKLKHIYIYIQNNGDCLYFYLAQLLLLHKRL